MRLRDQSRREIENVSLDEVLGLMVEAEHLLDIAAQLFVAAASLIEKCGATVWLALECGLEELIDFSPAVGFHPRFLQSSFGRATPWLAATRVAPFAARHSIPPPLPRCSSRRSNVTRRSCFSADRDVRARAALRPGQ